MSGEITKNIHSAVHTDNFRKKVVKQIFKSWAIYHIELIVKENMFIFLKTGEGRSNEFSASKAS